MTEFLEMVKAGEWLHPLNDTAVELINNSGDGEIFHFKEISQREINMHKCYFSLLGYVYDYLPDSFKASIPKNKFYLVIKDYQGEYKDYIKPNGERVREYTSISFAKMSEKRFKAFVKEQIPILYENILGAYFEGEQLQNIIETIELDYNKYFNKLFKND